MPRPLNQQVVVITGASTGIGRASALEFGRHGAAVVLAARHETALHEVAEAITQAGGRAHVVVTDVAEADQVEHLADEAIRQFGRIDTWVNNAGYGFVGPFETMKPAEVARLLQVNVAGLMYGTQAALSRMKPLGGGGIINVGSVVGIRGLPYRAVYSASKHAVKGFTEAVRTEQERAKTGITLTLIAPAVIETPFYDHEESATPAHGIPDGPVYSPEVVAESIVFAAEHPRREIFVGGAGKALDILQRLSPALVDLQFRSADESQLSSGPEGPDSPESDPVHGSGSPTRTAATSLYTKTFEWHPILKPIVLGSAAVGALALIYKLTAADPHPHTRVARETAQKLASKAKLANKAARKSIKSWF